MVLRLSVFVVNMEMLSQGFQVSVLEDLFSKMRGYSDNIKKSDT